MKNIIILGFMLLISGCFTLIHHPEVEVYYERDNGEEYLSEEYDVFVDEDCSTCHDTFKPQTHFNPMIPAHNNKSNWNDIPWWLDTKYLMFVSGNRDSNYTSPATSGYQHTVEKRRNDPPPAQQGGYITSPGKGGSSSSAGSEAVNSSRANEDAGSNSTSVTRSRNSENDSGSSSSTSKRKFRKRK